MSPRPKTAPKDCKMVADDNGVTVDTVRRWVRAGLLPSSIGLPGRYLFSPGDLNEFRRRVAQREITKAKRNARRCGCVVRSDIA